MMHSDSVLKTRTLSIEFNGQAVADTEITVEIGRWTRVPAISSACAAASLNERHRPHKHAMLVAKKLRGRTRLTNQSVA